MSKFYLWLEKQVLRKDAVGEYARKACRQNNYPRLSSTLHVLLKYEPDDRRSSLKRAHREWRKVRDASC